MYSLDDLSADDALIMARHLYLMTEDIDKVLYIQEALEHLLVPEFYYKMDIPIKYSAYTLIGHSLNIAYAISNDPGMRNHPDDFKLAEKFKKCTEIISKMIFEHQV